jgi:hypothetical protein
LASTAGRAGALSGTTPPESMPKHALRTDAEFERMRREADRAGNLLDERIANLVSAIGELIRRR